MSGWIPVCSPGLVLNFHVYMLRCSDGSYYVGHTDDLEYRLAQHERGELPGYTSARRPVRLVWCTLLESREDAFALERRIKGWVRAKKEALIRGDLQENRRLARGRNLSERGTGAAHPSTSPRPGDTSGPTARLLSG